LTEMHFERLADILNLPESIIINCLSMGSQPIFNDQNFLPDRGQMIYFKQNGIDYVLSQAVSNDPNYWVAFHPWSDRVVVGGIDEANVSNAVIDEAIINNILQNAQKCLTGEL